MKRIILSVTFCFVAFFLSAQEESDRIRSNEVSIDVFDLAFLRTIDISYEYIKIPDLGFGLTTRYCFDNEDLSYDERYSITPFLRYYFFSKKDYGSKGFYVESFMKFYGGEFSEYYYDYNFNYSHTDKKQFFDAAFGVGLGFKYVSKNGYTLDLNIGGGRPLGLSDHSNELVGRGCISFGYRF